MPNYNIPPGEQYPLGIDCASRPFGEAVKASPYSLICRYLSSGGSAIPNKQLMPDEAQSYLDNDIAIISNWETDGRMDGGPDQGYHAASLAWSWHKACNGPDSATIYFSLDYDAALHEQPNIDAYIQGIINRLGVEHVGLYAGYWPCLRAKQAFPDIKIWQTTAWSGSNVLESANLFQRVGAVNVGGADCDVNEIRTPGNTGAWQDKDINMGKVTSAIDGKEYPPEDMLRFIDYHTFNSDKKLDTIVDLLTRLVTKLGA